MTAIHPLDLPVLRRSPSYETLLTTLRALSPPPPRRGKSSFETPPPRTLAAGYITWLTRLCACPLEEYLPVHQAEELVRLASEVLSAQCGRSAAPAMTRSFILPTLLRPVLNCSDNEGEKDEKEEEGTVTVSVHEPTLTADALGLKTWSTSFFLARRLSTIFSQDLETSEDPENRRKRSVLELGSGTGLVGIACALVLKDHVVTLTDYLDDILRNLQRNVDSNAINKHKDESGRATATATVEWLDWTRPKESAIYDKKYSLVVASDFMYDVSHPPLVVDMFNHFTDSSPQAAGKVLAAYPLRPSNADFILDFQHRMSASHWTVLDSGIEHGYDDWGGDDEGVTVHWYLYRRDLPSISSVLP